ncbi:MAG TPA: thiamine phosphate synthase [Kineosporiaceae bacterium]|nr:thiamine phosphate synthase [Kineosporiaceae bacterium]
MASVGRLHLITDHRLGPRVPQFVAEAVAAGADCVQVRVARTSTDREALALTREVLATCREYGATCLVNDRVDVALAAGADGVHLGADDLPVAVARRILGDQALIGATARDPLTARRAEDDGADYLGVGPFRATRTKDGLPPAIGLAGVGAVAAAVGIPVLAIGGIVAGDLPGLLSAGAHGAAVVSALSQAADPAAALAELLEALTVAASPPGNASAEQGSVIDITVNGVARSVPESTTVTSLATALVGPIHSGIAVALNGTVLPPASWAGQAVRAGDRLEVIMALQGG